MPQSFMAFNLSGLNYPELAALEFAPSRSPSFPHDPSISRAGIQGECSDWTPDPFDPAQGRGEHSRTTIKTFGGDDLGIKFKSLIPVARCGVVHWRAAFAHYASVKPSFWFKRIMAQTAHRLFLLILFLGYLPDLYAAQVPQKSNPPLLTKIRISQSAVNTRSAVLGLRRVKGFLLKTGSTLKRFTCGAVIISLRSYARLLA